MGGGCEFLWDRHSGVSKTNSRSGLVWLLAEVLDSCDRSSGETASELFDFCDDTSWDAAAELALWGFMFCNDFCDDTSWDAAAELAIWGFMFCKRSSNGFWRDGGTMFLFCMV